MFNDWKWSKETNPATGEMFEFFHRYLTCAHNGNVDVDALLHSEYGDAWAKRLEPFFLYGSDPMGKKTLRYYEGLGLKKEMFETDDYFTRWALFTPLAMYLPENRDRKYPLVFVHHGGGNSLESEEFSTGFQLIAAKEGFMVANLQNTNPDNVIRVLDIIKEKYPLDESRVYVTGYSQGGMQTTRVTALYGERFAAAAPGGNALAVKMADPEEAKKIEDGLKSVRLPFLQMIGESEMSNIVPYNKVLARKAWSLSYPGDPVAQLHEDWSGDPTRLGPRPDFSVDPALTPEKRLEENVNARLRLLNCEPRDIEKCMAIGENSPEAERVTGFYGDTEEIHVYDGKKYYDLGIKSRDGVDMFHLVVLENAPHWPPLAMAQIEWDFFKQFRRNPETKALETIPYEY